MSPKLKSLKANGLFAFGFDIESEIDHLSGLISLEKFSFQTCKTYNQLLIELAEKLNLVELEIRMPCNANTYSIIKSFSTFESVE